MMELNDISSIRDVSAISEGLSTWTDVHSVTGGGGGSVGSVKTFFGRVDEIQILRDAYERLQTDTDSRGTEVVVVHGPSGTGKTKLIETALRNHVADTNGRFVAGKFDQIQRTGESYAALVAALSDLCDLLSALPEDEKDKLSTELSRELGTDPQALTRLIPNLSYLLPVEPLMGSSASIDAESRIVTPDQSIARLARLTRAFLSATSTTESPVVLFLDDVQWADKASLQLIESLLSETDIGRVLFIFAARDSNTEDFPPPQLDFIRPMMVEEETDSMSRGLVLHNLSVVEIGNLNRETVLRMVSEAMQFSAERQQTLTNMIYEKTNGNAYFTMQLLERLKAESASENTRYVQDLDKVDFSSVVSITDLVRWKLGRLPEPVQDALRLAAFLGYRFRAEILQVVLGDQGMLKEEKKPISLNVLVQILRVAVSEGVLHEIGNLTFKFSHDRVQACLSLIVLEEWDEAAIHLRIGRALEKHCSSTKEAGILSVVATDHMNLAQELIEDEEEKLRLVYLNIDAGRRMLRLCAYRPSLSYYTNAAILLDLDENEAVWESHYRLAFDTVSGLAYLEFSNGNAEKCNVYCQQALAHANSMEDKLVVYETMITAIGQRSGLRHAVAIGRSVLAELGEALPEHPTTFSVVREFLRVRAQVRGKTNEDLLNLPPMKNQEKAAATRLLEALTYVVFCDEESRELFGIIGLRMMYLTCKYGYSDRAGMAFALYGSMQAVLGNLDGTRRFKIIAEECLKKIESDATKTNCLFVLHALVSHWSERFEVGLAACKLAYTLGLEAGNISIALAAGTQYVNYCLYTDMPLSEVEAMTRKVARQMQEHKSQQLGRMYRPVHQTILNFMGLTDDPLKLTGEVMDEDEMTEILAEASDSLARISLISSRFQLAVTFEDEVLLNELFPEIIRFLPVLRGHFTIPPLTFQQGLAAYLLWHKTKKRKFRKVALQCTKRMQTWANQGVVNCLAPAKLLQVEKLILKTNMSCKSTVDSGSQRALVASQLDDAIAEAKKANVLYWQASFAKRGYNLFTSLYNDPEVAGRYLRDSIENYKRWEGGSVVRFLEKHLDRHPSRTAS